MTYLKSGFFLLLSLIVLSACVPHPQIPQIKRTIKSRSSQPVVNVTIFEGKDSVEITGKKLKLIFGRLIRKTGTDKMLLINKEDGFLWDRRLFRGNSIVIKGEDVSVDKIALRGDLLLTRGKEGISVINRLPMEEYLYGVINNEVSSAWPIESVKAQAVAARSYAFFKLNQAVGKSFSLQSTVMDQVYRGRATEDARARQAVDETKGEILFYDHIPAQAFFHSNCGGHTESAKNVWGGDYSYLKGVEDNYCTDAPNYFWIYQLSYGNILSILTEAGISVRRTNKISIIDRSKSGRVKAIKIGGSTLSGEELRKVLGYSKLKSANFTISANSNQITFSGSGFGHGVGMCQWGAKGMAQAGSSYREILKKYYDGVDIKKIY